MRRRNRRGISSLDYILLSCVVLPLVAMVMYYGRWIMQYAYEMMSILIAWPFG